MAERLSMEAPRFSEGRLHKVFGVTSRGPAGDCLRKTGHVLGAMIELNALEDESAPREPSAW